MWPASGATAATKDRCSASAAIGRSKRCSTSITTPRFEPGTQYRYSNFGWILVSAAVEAAADEPFLSFMHKQIFEPLGMDHTDADSATEPSPDLATSYFPRFAADPRYGPDVMRPIDYSCYAGSSVFVSTPSDLVRFAHRDQQRQAAATRHGPIAPDATATDVGAGDGLRSWLGSRDRRRWRVNKRAGRPRRAVLGGMVASFMTFPEHGIVVAVTSNTSYADTESLALKIAQAFAEQKQTPASK